MNHFNGEKYPTNDHIRDRCWSNESEKNIDPNYWNYFNCEKYWLNYLSGEKYRTNCHGEEKCRLNGGMSNSK